VHDFGMFFFGFEDAVVENLFIVLQARSMCHSDRYYQCKIFMLN